MTKSAPYFPFYPNDWLDDEDIFNMGLECEGAYIRLLSAMWKRDGFIPDKSIWICNILRCKPAKWKKIRRVLVEETGVISLENDCLFNQRLTKELNFFNEKSKKSAQNANKRWSKQVKTDTKKANKINGTEYAVALQSQCHTDTDTDTDTDKRTKNTTTSTQANFLEKSHESLSSLQPAEDDPAADEDLSPEVNHSPVRVPYQKIIELYHEVLIENPTVRKLTETRKKYMRQRWLDGDLPDLETWESYFKFVKKSPFLTGKTNGYDNKPPFIADIEWLCRPSNYTKIYERKYHR